MKKDSNKYLSIGISLGLCLGSGTGIILSLIMKGVNFIFSIPLGAGFGMLSGIVVGSIFDSNSKK